MLHWILNKLTLNMKQSLYLKVLLNKMFILWGRGLYLAGMDSHVLRPMITAFCFPANAENCAIK